MAAAGDDSIGLILNHDAAATLSHRNSDLSLDQGDACLVLTDEPGMVAGRGQLGLVFPRAPLVARMKNIADATAIRIPRESDALRLLKSYLRALPKEQALGSPKLQRTVINHIYDLTMLAMCPDRPTDENSRGATAAARLELALSFIGRHFEEPDLTVSAAARHQNISPRYLQRLIETTGSTFSAHMNELRLQRACVLLTDPRHRNDRISDIALRVGFSDIAHFNRSFRRRFGDTPSTIRAEATTAGRA
jgi:AraC-like DNA-binding protein